MAKKTKNIDINAFVLDHVLDAVATRKDRREEREWEMKKKKGKKKL